MTGRFLLAAYEVLHLEGKPLTPEQITSRAIAHSMLYTKGITPANTMRARICENIRSQGNRSHFQRVGPNRFALREWDFAEYYATSFQRAVPNEITVCLPGTIQDIVGAAAIGYSPVTHKFMHYISEKTNLLFLDRHTAETTSKYKQLIAYVWLETEDGLILSYTRGKYSSADRALLLGRRSVGFGGHVLHEDAENLFSFSDAGLEQAAIREISEELGGVFPTELSPVGVIWDDSSFEGQKHIGVVMTGRLPHSSSIPSRANEMSITQLRLLTKSDLWGAFHTMEFWSQLLIKEFASKYRPQNISSITPSRRPRRIKYLAFVGEIANGKTFFAKAISKAFNCSVISASATLRQILNVSGHSEEVRFKFQSLALDFIKSENAPKQLAEAIADQVKRAQTKIVIIDGIRQLSTLAVLRALLTDLVVIYIDCPRDLAFRNYVTRRPDASVLQFAAVREHPVESELPLFRFEADTVLNNADDVTKTLELLVNWIGEDQG